MSRIAEAFARCRGAGRAALVPYVTAGDPDPGLTVELMHALVRAGADLIELGVPFSDPMADGPVIQAACERALAKGTTLDTVLAQVAAFRRDDPATPVILMGYANPLEVMGYGRFAEAAAGAGVDGVLTVDLPPEEAGDVVPVLRGAGLDPVFLLAPTSDEDRIRAVGRVASGFVYYVSLKGVTGAAHLDVEDVARRLAVIRRHIDLPIGVGFGIHDAAAAGRVAGVADAVVVGSALVRRIAEHAAEPARAVAAAAEFLQTLRGALDAAVAHAVQTGEGR
ncbi:MAG: tryptophan synthase alpha chain [Gammaproteobacteria bacterium]|nr:MAG: tryptophan synthase alpha chain [Gammaproteobacteria bacterium]